MYFILDNHPRKYPFAELKGALLNSKGDVTPNIFGDGTSVKKTADMNYSIQIDDRYSEEGDMTDRLLMEVHSSDPLLVLSDKAKIVFEKNVKNLTEFYSLKFEYKRKKYTNYSIANVIQKIDCADYKKSEINFESYDDETDEPTGPIYSIDRLVINPKKVPKQTDIFLLGNIEHTVIVISDRLKKIIEKEKLSGFSFLQPEEFAIGD